MRSQAFHGEVFALPVAFELPPDADDATRTPLGFLYGAVIYKLGDGLSASGRLRRPTTASTRTASVSITAASRSVPEQRSKKRLHRLDNLGIKHGGVTPTMPVRAVESNHSQHQRRQISTDRLDGQDHGHDGQRIPADDDPEAETPLG